MHYFNKKRYIVFCCILFVSSLCFAQNEIYNKMQVNIINRNPQNDSPITFGSFFNEAKALVYFNHFWVEGRIGLQFQSLDNWKTGEIAIMKDRTHGNVGWTLFKNQEFVFGTQYYKMLPGTYMNAYEDALPDGRYGKTGANYETTVLKEKTGLTFGLNIPIQDKMFTKDNFAKVHGAIIYEPLQEFALGTAFYTDLKDDIKLATFLSGQTEKLPFSWMVGYTYNGTGINGETPATHYFDSTFNVLFSKVNLAADFEIGYYDKNDTVPLYVGLLGIYFPKPTIQLKATILYNALNAKDFETSQNTLFIYPRVILTIGKNDISIGPQFTLLHVPNSKIEAGFAFPIYWKHSF